MLRGLNRCSGSRLEGITKWKRGVWGGNSKFHLDRGIRYAQTYQTVLSDVHNRFKVAAIKQSSLNFRRQMVRLRFTTPGRTGHRSRFLLIWCCASIRHQIIQSEWIVFVFADPMRITGWQVSVSEFQIQHLVRKHWKLRRTFTAKLPLLFTGFDGLKN